MRLLLPVSLLIAATIAALAMIGLFISPANWFGQIIGFIIAAVILVGAGFIIIKGVKGRISGSKEPNEPGKPTPPDELYQPK